ncbi:FAD-dependent monooxygenase [Ramlibacter rhizophilus]|uniref:3-hydroxybenzoate 6-monooxygenase n=1 Tax=Ramlibacter rhizophilus TaxID=1781167 RepID=A0A4Z0BLT4_9BURK|nr:FAD-dependent monooxygenase [Ramlibacter rhizophilus]TFY99760.1 3-hydroxybenzoate 6-monooxygenase [Ramlibacter rhizophilus]
MKGVGGLPVVVVGAGIGGLATALTLGRQGRPVSVLEQADQIGAIGYGVQIGPNVLPLLQRLGLGEAVLQKGYLPTEIRWLDLSSGAQIADIPLHTEAFARRYAGSRYMAIHRVDLHELLLAACKALPNVALNQATAVTGYRQEGERLAVLTAEGREVEAAAVIGADGLRSRIRAQMQPGDAPRDTGYVAHRTIVPMEEAPQLARRRTGVTMWSGAGVHVIYYPLRERTELNIVLVVRVPPGVESDSPAYREHLARVMADAQAEPRELIARVNLGRRWAIADRDPIRRWCDGRVTLLGDAAHATLQSLAQGAGMAVEDAALLGDLLQEAGQDYAAAFQRLNRARFLRTARVQLESRALWDIYHCDGLDAEVRALQWGERRPEDFYSCLDWLWTPMQPAP